MRGFWFERRASRDEDICGASKIEDGGEGEKVGGVGGERMTSCARLSVDALHGAEHALDGSATLGDQAVAHGHPARRHWHVLVPPVHDAVLDAARLQAGAPRL